MKSTHRHKWVLKYTYAGTLGEGLLYHCSKCSSCLEFNSKTSKINIERIHNAYRTEIKRLKDIIRNKI